MNFMELFVIMGLGYAVGLFAILYDFGVLGKPQGRKLKRGECSHWTKVKLDRISLGPSGLLELNTNSQGTDLEAYIESNGQKHELTWADMQSIQESEAKTRNSRLVLATVILLAGLSVVAVAALWGRAMGDASSAAGGLFGALPLIIVAIGGAAYHIMETNKKVFAVRSGQCSAYIIEVAEKLWDVDQSSADNNGGYKYYIRCDEYIVQVPNRRIYNRINGNVLVVKYSYNPKINITGYYPAAT